ERFNDIQTKLHGLDFFGHRYVLDDDDNSDNYYPFRYIDNYFKYDDSLSLEKQIDEQIVINEKLQTEIGETTNKPDLIEHSSSSSSTVRSTIVFVQLSISNDQISSLDKRYVSVYLNPIQYHTEIVLPLIQQQEQQQFNWIHFSFCTPSPTSSLSSTSSTMSYMYDSIPEQQNSHWNENNDFIQKPRRSSSQHITNIRNKRNNETKYFSEAKLTGERISLAASLPFNTKLNIRIQADRLLKQQKNKNNDDLNYIKTTASIESLDPANEHIYFSNINKHYQQHYSTADSLLAANATMHFYYPDRQIQKQQRYNDSSGENLYHQKLPRTRKISLPVSLPIDKRICLYIRNGEVLARC
ncbi:unnamed protein product, partial [Didymodactylos carnosus]